MIGLLHLLRTDGAMVEADLHRWYHIDLVDLWRGRLSLRKVGVLVRHLPSEAATIEKLTGNPGWSLEAILLDDLRMALTGSKERRAKPHPTRARIAKTARRSSAQDPDRRAKWAETHARRQAELAALTADEEG